MPKKTRKEVDIHETDQFLLAQKDITKGERGEQAAGKQEARAQQRELQAALIELAQDPILVRDSQGHILAWNRGAEELYGWTTQEAVGQISHFLLQTSFPVSRETIDTLLERERRWEGELVHKHRDGASIIVVSHQVLVCDEMGRPEAILEINRDITEQRRLELTKQQMYVETEARLNLLQRILDELPGSVYLVHGPDARLVLANPSAATIWGASWLPGQPMEAFLTSHGIRIFDVNGRPLPLSRLATVRAVETGESVWHHEEIIRHPDGITLPVLVNAVALDAFLLPVPAVPLKDPTAKTGRLAIVTHQDVSALKEAQQFKDEFLSIAAHELRTPMAVLKGFADTLLMHTRLGRGPALADWQVESLGEINQAVLRLDRLTNDLLDVTRLQAGRFAMHRERLDFVELIRWIVDQRQLTTERHTLSFQTAVEQAPVEVDRGRVEQVLGNLLGNAIKYSPQGGLVEVTLRQEDETKEFLLSIQDQGIGIPEYEQVFLFGRFIRAENVHMHGIGGTGLGLYLCRQLVEWHGGRIWFTSTEGAGSTFFIALPRAANQEKTIPAFDPQA